jgi:hypothetical protein
MKMSKPEKIHIEAKYVGYTEAIEAFTPQKIKDRYARLFASAQEFIKEMGYTDHVVCNETMLMLAVLECYSDLLRLKKFHEIENTNDIKILAYETSWLLRRKPLQIKPQEESKDGNIGDQKYEFCNEQFAFSQITFWFEKDNGEKGIKALAHRDLKFFSDTLFYHLKYRNYDPQTLELMLVSFMAGRTYQHLLDKVPEKKESIPDTAPA